MSTSLVLALKKMYPREMRCENRKYILTPLRIMFRLANGTETNKHTPHGYSIVLNQTNLLVRFLIPSPYKECPQKQAGNH